MDGLKKWRMIRLSIIRCSSERWIRILSKSIASNGLKISSSVKKTRESELCNKFSHVALFWCESGWIFWSVFTDAESLLGDEDHNGKDSFIMIGFKEHTVTTDVSKLASFMSIQALSRVSFGQEKLSRWRFNRRCYNEFSIGWCCSRSIYCLWLLRWASVTTVNQNSELMNICSSVKKSMLKGAQIFVNQV